VKTDFETFVGLIILALIIIAILVKFWIYIHYVIKFW